MVSHEMGMAQVASMSVKQKLRVKQIRCVVTDAWWPGTRLCLVQRALCTLCAAGSKDKDDDSACKLNDDHGHVMQGWRDERSATSRRVIV